MQKFNGLFIFLGLIGFGLFIDQGLKEFNRDERSISVRGLAEKEVKSNVAVWKISFTVSSDRMEQVRTELPETQKAIQEFLISHGFEVNEIAKSSNIKDRQAQEYGAEKGNRFVAYGTYIVTTNKVDKVEQTGGLVDDLLKKGIVITRQDIDFFFTDLNAIKPEMLDLATRNAKEAAQGFAKSMDVGVGRLKSASQGVFSIDNPIGDVTNEYGTPSQSSIMKKVRVVTQVEFYID